MDNHHQRRDLQMIETAITKRWLTDDLKPKAIEAIKAGLESSDDRVKARAVSALIKMESQNQQDEHKVVDIGIANRNARLDAIAADLGIEPGLIANATGASGDSDSGT